MIINFVKRKKAFTITELMVSVIIIGVIAGFAIPDYLRSVRRAHQQDMSMQLTALHAASMIYQSQNGTFLVETSLPLNGTPSINNDLGINIISTDGTNYSYTSDGTNFTATAIWNFSTGPVTFQVDQRPISTTSVPPNPQCTTNCL